LPTKPFVARAGAVMAAIVALAALEAQTLTRARDLGIPFDGTPGPLNAITDVAGVEVGMTTLIRGDGPLVMGKGPVRTGVTAILPRGRRYDPVFAGWYTLNGNGEMTGTTWITEAGFLETPILITNTFSVGVVRDAAVHWMQRNHYFDAFSPRLGDLWYAYPLVAETYDGLVNDISGQHVQVADAMTALDGARSGPVQEGSVGGGTGMICHLFKCGTGTASRRTTVAGATYTVGVVVQANHGNRGGLTIAGVPVGREITDLMPVFNPAAPGKEVGSIIVIVATDAPLLAHQLERLARRVPLGIGRVGGQGGNGSGDIFLAFSTANAGAAKRTGVQDLKMLANDEIDPLFAATIQSTEEAIVNALVAGRTMTGINGNTVYGMPHDRVREILKKYNRLGK
jgi:L-aminopeptidase/D-esterase-like protein